MKSPDKLLDCFDKLANDKQYTFKAATHLRVRRHDPSKEFQETVCKTFEIGTGLNGGLDSDLADVPALRMEDVVGSRVSFGGALVAGVFRCDGLWGEDSTRILVEDISLVPSRLARLIRRLCHIHAYMMVGMQPFDEARKQLQETQIYQEKLRKALKFRYKGIVSNFRTQRTIGKVNAYVSEITAVSRHHFNGTDAYARQLRRLVDELHEEWEKPFQRIGFYLGRHFSPGSDRCSAAVRCQDNLSQRVKQVASILQSRMTLETGSVVKLIGIIASGVSIIQLGFETPKPEYLGNIIIVLAVVLFLMIIKDDVTDLFRWIKRKT